MQFTFILLCFIALCIVYHFCAILFEKFISVFNLVGLVGTWRQQKPKAHLDSDGVKKNNISSACPNGSFPHAFYASLMFHFFFLLLCSHYSSSTFSSVFPSPGAKVISGQQVNLTCSFGEPLPSGLRVKWVPPERSNLTLLTPDHQPAHLTIPEVGEGDGGKWRCELWRDEKLTFAEITLTIGECRKWEQSRKCDMGTTLWQQCFLHQKVLNFLSC